MVSILFRNAEASSTEPIGKKTLRSARSVKKPETTNPKGAVNVAMSSRSVASTKKAPAKTRTISSILKDAEGSSTQASERPTSRASSSRQSSAAVSGAPRMTKVSLDAVLYCLGIGNRTRYR